MNKEEDNDKKYFLHKSKSSEKMATAFYITFSIGEPRTLLGTVFEDTKDSSRAEENIGNGIMDNSELNRAKGVLVELIDADGNVAKLYSKDIVKDEHGNYKTKVEDAKTKTDASGEYKFTGVVPGYYYIRFTYGDGSQKMVQVLPNGSKKSVDIKSSDYKSTIINTKTGEAGDTIKNAMEFKYPSKLDTEEKRNVENRKYGSWYTKLRNTNYSTAVDDITYRNNTSTVSFDDRERSITNLNAKTPIVAISIENDTDDISEDGGFSEREEDAGKYKGFNLGLIKQVHDIKIEKSITNVEFGSQIGTKLVSGNPVTSDSEYMRNSPVAKADEEISDVSQLAKYVTLETEPEFIYGSSIKTTYRIRVKNNSPKDYIEDGDNNPYYGYYYKYGLHGSKYNSKEKTIKIESVYDFLDPKYINGDTVSIKQIGNEEKKISAISSYDKNYEDHKKGEKYVSIEGWKDLKSGDDDSIEYSLADLVADAERDDTNYENKAKIAKLKVGKLTTLESGFYWDDSEATLTIFPDTGENRSYTYLIVGISSLTTIAIGFVLIKKKVLK